MRKPHARKLEEGYQISIGLVIFLFLWYVGFSVKVISKLTVQAVTFQSTVQTLRRHRRPAMRKRTEVSYSDIGGCNHGQYFLGRESQLDVATVSLLEVKGPPNQAAL